MPLLRLGRSCSSAWRTAEARLGCLGWRSRPPKARSRRRGSPLRWRQGNKLRSTCCRSRRSWHHGDDGAPAHQCDVMCGAQSMIAQQSTADQPPVEAIEQALPPNGCRCDSDDATCPRYTFGSRLPAVSCTHLLGTGPRCDCWQRDNDRPNDSRCAGAARCDVPVPLNRSESPFVEHVRHRR